MIEVPPISLEVFQYIIDFIYKVLTININIGNGWNIQLFWVMAWIFIVVAIIKLVTLDFSRAMRGDRSENYAKPVKTVKLKRGSRL
jgi:hypothetical protein